MGSVDVLSDLIGRVVRFLFHLCHDNIGNEMRICHGVLQTHTRAVVMLVNKRFDDEFECIIFASIDRPGTTLVLALHVELISISFDNLDGKVIFDSISCIGMFQCVNRLPFGAKFKGIHSGCCLRYSGVFCKHG